MLFRSRLFVDAQARFSITRARIAHRLGPVAVGEASVVVVVSAPHRGPAFDACRYLMERLKHELPIWKREHFDGGDVWLEGAVADPDDSGARDTAYRIACA